MATPNQIAKVEKAFDKTIGEKVNWINFGSGSAMTEAMLAGDIDISYSQGLAPFVNAVIAGDTGLTIEKTNSQMADFTFPTNEEQMSGYFNDGGRVATMLSFMGKMFATTVAPAKDDYSKVVDTSFLK